MIWFFISWAITSTKDTACLLTTILASDLFAQKTHVTGTLDKSQKGVPYNVIDCYGNLSSKTRPGMYVRDGCAVYSVWKDTNYLLTKWPMADLFLALIRYISNTKVLVLNWKLIHHKNWFTNLITITHQINIIIIKCNFYTLMHLMFSL